MTSGVRVSIRVNGSSIRSRVRRWRLSPQESKISTVKAPGLEPVPYVVIKLPDGKTVLRHPDEVKPIPKK